MNPAQFPKSLLSPVIRDHLTKQSNQQYPPSSFLIITESKPAIRNSDELLLPHPGGFSPWFPPPEKRPLWIAGRWRAQPKRMGRARARTHARCCCCCCCRRPRALIGRVRRCAHGSSFASAHWKELVALLAPEWLLRIYVLLILIDHQIMS